MPQSKVKASRKRKIRPAAWDDGEATAATLGTRKCYILSSLHALVEEKETRVKETMYVMGLKAWVFSISWATTYLVRLVLFLLTVFHCFLRKQGDCYNQ